MDKEEEIKTLKTIINVLLDWLEEEHLGLEYEAHQYILDNYNIDVWDF